VQGLSRVGAATLAAALVLGVAAGAGPARADDPDFLSLSAGAFDVNDDMTAAEFRLEYRSDLKWWIFKPFTGIMGNSDAGFYGYGGVLIDLFLGRRFVLTPSFAVGAYDRGDGKDLGHSVEFRSQIEIAYRFDDRSRLALSFSHMSNASIDEVNPGTESLMLTYAFPFDVLLGR
jgi:hypothetical protein